MSLEEATILAWLAVMALATIIGAIHVAYKLRTDRQYRRQFWQALDEEWKERQR